jgi:hypothetical protein
MPASHEAAVRQVEQRLVARAMEWPDWEAAEPADDAEPRSRSMP